MSGGHFGHTHVTDLPEEEGVREERKMMDSVRARVREKRWWWFLGRAMGSEVVKKKA